MALGAHVRESQWGAILAPDAFRATERESSFSSRMRVLEGRMPKNPPLKEGDRRNGRDHPSKA